MISTKHIGLGMTFGGIVVALYLHLPQAHADPDICGTGKFYNPYDNSCVPTDRGAYPNSPMFPNQSGPPPYSPRGY